MENNKQYKVLDLVSKDNLKVFDNYVTLIINPICNLTNRESQVASMLLYLYDIEINNGVDEKLAMLNIMDYNYKQKIMKSLDMSEFTLNNILSYLRKKKFLIDKAINKNYIYLTSRYKAVILYFNE